MAESSQKSIRQSLGAVVGKSRRFKVFGHKSTPRGLQTHTKVRVGSSPTTSRKKFKKSDNVEHDIGVLAMTYVLQDNPTIQELICIIVGLHDRSDSDRKLSEILTLSATFTIQLASFHEEDSSEALTAITTFLTTMRAIDIMARNKTKTTNYMADMVNDSITQIKSKNPALVHCDRNIDSDKGLPGIYDTIIGTTSTIVDILNQASVAIPVPFVKPLVASVASLLRAVQQTRSNLDDMRQVATFAGEFVVMLAVVCAGEEMKPSQTFQQALSRLQGKLHDIAQQCSELSRRNVLWRFFQQGVDQTNLSEMKQDLHNAVIQFQTETQLLQHFDLWSLSQVINGKLGALNIQQDEDAVNALPKPLSYVGRRDEYLPGSRSDVIQIIADWLENSNQLAFWMRGGAGLGKSTLAHEIVDSLRFDGRLATFAFLVRGSSSNPATVIQTMARELCALHPGAIRQVAVAARTCNSSHLPLHEYLESYIIKPIRSLLYPYSLVIVIDGLDEWDDHEAFLTELGHIPPSSFVKILLISRPYHSIERSLLEVPVQKYELPPVSQAITEEYFIHHFEKIDWKMRKPSSFTISELARLADGLLIWAAMVCALLSNKMRPGPPHEHLEHILSSGKQVALAGQLSNLYHDTLKQLFQDKDRELFQRVFGAMIILQAPLPLPDFARLLGMYDDQVIEIQSRLTSLQTRGTFDEHTVPPASQRFHSSFVEFTMTLEAHNPLNPYPVSPRIAHESIAEGCLKFLNNFISSFRGNNCGHSDLRGLELYAVEFWPLHVAHSNERFTSLSPELERLLLQMPDHHLRQWGSWFLAISISASSLPMDWDQVVGCINKDEFYCSLAELLRNGVTDATLTSRRTFCLEVAVRLQPKPEKAWRDLGNTYRERFNSTNTMDLLDNAITVYRRVLELSIGSNRSQFTAMSKLGSALQRRYSRTGSMCDLEEAILMHRASLSLCPTSDRERHISLTYLATALQYRFGKTESMTDLEEAVLMHRQSLSLHPDAHPARSLSLNNLGNALQNRFGKTGSMFDLNESISMHRESLFLRPSLHPYRSSSLNNLANALQDRFRKTGLMIDLDEAISMHRESLSLHPAPHPDRSMSLNNLAVALRNRFRKTRSMIDLEEAILMHRESLFFRPAPHPDRFMSLNNLALALQGRFGKTGSTIDLEEAISMFRESLSLCLAPHPGRLGIMTNLAYALETRSKEQSDFDEATLLRQEVLAISSRSDIY